MCLKTIQDFSIRCSCTQVDLIVILDDWIYQIIKTEHIIKRRETWLALFLELFVVVLTYMEAWRLV